MTTKPAKPQHSPGDFRVYDSTDAATGAKRQQLILVTGLTETGHVLGKPLGWADEGASFEPGQLAEVGTPVSEDGGGDGDGG